jgi:hypothetical protein
VRGGWQAQRRRFWALAIVIGGCRSAPPLPPPPPPPPPPRTVVADPAPVPKCETAEEACVARADTRARIARVSGFDMAPPEGWTYAQGDEVTMATGKNAVLGVTAHPTALDAKKERSLREETLELVTQKIGVAMARKKDVFWRKPDQKQKVGEIDLFLYQVDGSRRGGKKGPLLVFIAKLDDVHTLLGAGFVSYDDADNADRAILKAIGSIAPSGASAGVVSRASP